MSRAVCGICWCPYDGDGKCGCTPQRNPCLRSAAKAALEAIERGESFAHMEEIVARALRAALEEPSKALSDSLADPTNPETNPLPDEAQELVAALIEGRVRSLFIVAEIDGPDETEWIEGFSLDMDDHQTDQRSFIGAIQLNLHELQNALVDQQFTLTIKNQDDDDEEEEE